MPRIGVLTWKEFERDIGWTNFFVLASSLSLARAQGQRRQRLGRRPHHRRGAGVSGPAVLRRRDADARLGAGAVTDSQHHRLSRHHDSDCDGHRHGHRREPDGVRAGGDDRRRCGALLSGAERVIARGVRARIFKRAGDF